jgi:amino acid transporter
MICPLNPIAGPWFENGTDKKRGNGIIYIYVLIMILIITITLITIITIITMITIMEIIIVIIITIYIYIHVYTHHFSLQPWPLRAGPALAPPGLPAAPETLEFAKFLSHLARDVALRI